MWKMTKLGNKWKHFYYKEIIREIMSIRSKKKKRLAVTIKISVRLFFFSFSENFKPTFWYLTYSHQEIKYTC